MLPTHAVGIDLGTTYSCLSYLNEHGEPITVPNKDGELSTPSVVLFDGDHVVVGTEALRNSIRHPDKVIVHAKRYMGSPTHRWKIGGKSYSPIDISTFILKSMLDSARERVGEIERAVITVPAQFSDVQRQATAEAGKRAGLKHVDIINEPVAAALCFVLGTEGIWFTELATAQTIMVVDLGGGTFDLSLVRYQKNEVRVIASGGDLHLGGLDWNKALEVAIGKQFQKEFAIDPTKDRESAQALALEAEQTKRSLSVRPKAALTCAAGGQRKTYQVELEQFERLTKDLVDRSESLTLDLLKEHNMGWAKIDVVLTTGGSSRMPMIRSLFKRLSGRTLNTSLSPDQSIAHGATYYAGMLLS
ncbi:MAG: Hsp70 family protein, partial [Candidatus Saccharimonas sp.]|nr:Hsp70 family protein [Planctomycetaceae bacterium]